MTIEEINKKIDTFEDIFVSDVRDILYNKYPDGFSFYIAHGNIDNFINLNNDVVSNEKILYTYSNFKYTYIKVTNKQLFDNVSVYVQLKNLINRNINFQEVLPFIEKLKSIYKDNLDYSKTKLYFNCKGSIHSGKFTYMKYGTEFYTTKPQILKGKYRESYSDNIIDIKPIEGVYCDSITGLSRDNNIPVHVKYKGDIFEISTYSYQYKPIQGSYEGEWLIDEELPYYNGTLNVLKDDKTWHNNFYDNIYYEIGCDTKSIRKISDYLSHCCTIEGAYCFIKKDGTVDLIDNHSSLYPKIRLNHKITKAPIPQGIKFGICEGHFDYSNMGVESLKGCPDVVFGDFNCSKNNLKNLTGLPSIIYGNLNLSDNSLLNDDLDTINSEIFGNINIKNTQIIK